MRYDSIGQIVRFSVGDNRIWIVTSHNPPYCEIKAIPGGKIKTVKTSDVTQVGYEDLLSRYRTVTPSAKAISFAHNTLRRENDSIKWKHRILKKMVQQIKQRDA